MFLIVLVLIQRGKGGGLAGALGGMGGQSAFGTKAGDLFTRITIGVAAFWIILCMCRREVFGCLGGAAERRAAAPPDRRRRGPATRRPPTGAGRASRRRAQSAETVRCGRASEPRRATSAIAGRARCA